jgi:hypothetical protein
MVEGARLKVEVEVEGSLRSKQGNIADLHFAFFGK